MAIDWNATVAWIAFGVAVITPVVTTFLNNRFQLKLKKMEQNFSKQSTYYEKQRLCIETFLTFASKQIETNYESERIEFCKCFHELLLYLPKEDWDQAKELYDSIIKRDKDSVQRLYAVTEILASRLQESSQKFPI